MKTPACRNRRGGVLIRLLILIAFAAVAYSYWRSGSIVRLKGVSARLEASVNRELVRQGVTDRQIRSQVHRERTRAGIAWVETDREIVPDDFSAIARREARWTQIARRYGCSLSRTQDPEQITLDIGRWFVRFERIRFLRSAASAKVSGVPAARAALVIDDVAYTLEPMDHYAALGIPLTFAILPRDRHCRELA